MALYRNFITPEDIDAEYLIVDRIEDYEAQLAWYGEQSAKTRASLAHEISVKFGPTLPEYVDIFPAKQSNAPIMIFIHGGYWKMCEAADFHFVAQGLHACGITTLVANYDLCPRVSISEITRQNRALVAWAYQHAADFGADRDRIYVSGHSAGGHQVGMVAVTDWAGVYGLPADIVKGGVSISGLFDLAPFVYSFLQPTLQLSAHEVQRQSPIKNIPQHAGPDLILTLGQQEAEEFHRQSAAFAEAWTRAGNTAKCFALPGEHHFNCMRAFIDPQSALLGSICDMIQPD